MTRNDLEKCTRPGVNLDWFEMTSGDAKKARNTVSARQKAATKGPYDGMDSQFHTTGGKAEGETDERSRKRGQPLTQEDVTRSWRLYL